MDIFNYVKKNTLRFADDPFNDVDGLVLSQLVYTKFEAALPALSEAGDMPGVCASSDHTSSACASSGRASAGRFRIKDFYMAEYFPEMFNDGLTDKENREFFTTICASPRFRDLVIKYIVSKTDQENEMQFAAFTFEIDDKTEYVAFRGTDGSLFGWKEDMKLSFLDEIPAQRKAVEYLNKFFGTGGPSGDKYIHIGGHSKGGNLAIYSASFSDPDMHERMLTVRSYEGPGFRDNVAIKIEESIKRDELDVAKYVTQGSIVGMMLQPDQTGLKVVKAKAIGWFQHASYAWQIDDSSGCDFLYTEMAYTGEYNGRTIHGWLEQVPDEDRAAFTDAVFDILFLNGIKTVNDLKKINFTKLGKMIDSYSNMKAENKQVLKNVVGALAKTAIVKVIP